MDTAVNTQTTNGNQLGRLERVDLRDIWTSEATHFTPWLARHENLTLLGDAIGMELELEASEKDVGPFRADILCKDTATDNWVLVENQLERTDHVHLGQLMTYASGLKAVTIVWIAKRFTEEHRAALDWLNQITDDRFNFFGLEVELWRIASSPIAPKFNIIAKPNDWTRTVAAGASKVESDNLTETKLLQREFWEGFREYLIETGSVLKPRKALPQHWMNLAIGKTGFKLSAIAAFKDSEEQSFDSHEIRAEFVITHSESKRFFEILEAEKDEIERELGDTLVWYNPPEKRMCRIYLRQPTDLRERKDWQECFEWLKLKLELLREIFQSRLRQFE